MNNVLTSAHWSQRRTNFATNSGPLSLRRCCDVPWTAKRYCRTPITCWAIKECDTSIARLSRVVSSITARSFSRRPSSVRSDKKSNDQTWSSCSARRRTQLFSLPPENVVYDAVFSGLAYFLVSRDDEHACGLLANHAGPAADQCDRLRSVDVAWPKHAFYVSKR